MRQLDGVHLGHEGVKIASDLAVAALDLRGSAHGCNSRNATGRCGRRVTTPTIAEFVAARQRAPRPRGRDRPGPARARRRRGHRQLGHPRRRSTGADGHRLRPDPGALRRRAATAPRRPGVELEWVQADAEDLPFEDALVRRRHLGDRRDVRARTTRPSPRELLRVTKPGGTIGMANWTPEGLDRPDVQGHEAVRAAAAPRRAARRRCGAARTTSASCSATGCSDLKMERHVLSVTDFATPRGVRRRSSRPSTARRSRSRTTSATTPTRRAEFDAAYLDFAERADSGEPGAARFDQEYLIVVGTRA